MSDMSRRQFVAAATAATCACLLGPSSLLRAARASVGPVIIGPLQEFAKDGMVSTWARSHGFFLIRQDGKLYASSSICTHKNTVYLNEKLSGGQLLCSQHGSRFTLQGEVAHGPARHSLARYAISVNDKGIVTVDTSRQFEQDQWKNPDCFVKLT